LISRPDIDQVGVIDPGGQALSPAGSGRESQRCPIELGRTCRRPPAVGQSVGSGCRFGDRLEVSVSQFTVRRLAVLAGSIASLLATVGANAFLLQAASASRIVKGCTVVDNPTLQHHTSCAGAGLSRANLSRTNLSYADLTHANLSHAKLSRTNLYHANLSDASLDGANLTQAHLSHGDLTNASLAHANLSHASVRGANLSHTNLLRANLSDADLRNADLTDARFCHTTMPNGHVNNSGC
jgi:hypothetical protein